MLRLLILLPVTCWLYLQLFCLTNVLPEVIDKKHLGVKNTLLHFFITDSLLLVFCWGWSDCILALEGHKDRFEKQAKVKQENDRTRLPRWNLLLLFCIAAASLRWLRRLFQMIGAWKQQKVAEDIAALVLLEDSTRLENSDEIVSLHVILPINRQLEHMLPDGIVRVVHAAKKAEIEVIYQLLLICLLWIILWVLSEMLTLRGANALLEYLLLDALGSIVKGRRLMPLIL